MQDVAVVDGGECGEELHCEAFDLRGGSGKWRVQNG